MHSWFEHALTHVIGPTTDEGFKYAVQGCKTQWEISIRFSVGKGARFHGRRVALDRIPLRVQGTSLVDVTGQRHTRAPMLEDNSAANRVISDNEIPAKEVF